MGQPAEKKFLSADELVARWGDAIHPGTLANWRVQGKGPAFIKLGAKVRYPIAQLEQWEAAHMVAANDNNIN
ncbi:MULTISPECIES: helix-turn-helix transcriptional regulator [Cupriavidus]|uniref:DNA-binding protein n=2 Tax=Cupriavidus TaxID=106589 RepID=A0A916IUM2_9BURK|nr:MULTISPECIES: helix-turn-helix domain-containing protein [Cupriavidus]CAG2144581.1 hypothetical protein LMG31506_03038 [Cupriavidus yeoncheonensis]SOZ37709.1 conserved hypothetical protein [Cupriavidus neocaledonicus]SPD46283.1 conserved protein of unknown function [Cupriavidus neocaledonicus]